MRKEGLTDLAVQHLKGSPDWQTVRVTLSDLHPADERQAEPLTTWQSVTQVQFSPTGSVIGKDGTKTEVGKLAWENPTKNALHNLRWEGGTYGDATVAPAELKAPADFDRQFNDAIKQSLEQERRDRKER